MTPQDNWSTTTSQYRDAAGGATFTGTVLQGIWEDTSQPPYGATQQPLGSEADAFTAANAVVDTADAQIVVATQSGTCPQNFGGTNCPTPAPNKGYCAWHAMTQEPFINLPYELDAGTECGEYYINSKGVYDGFTMNTQKRLRIQIRTILPGSIPTTT